MSAPTVLVTGGAGFIGSHTCVELLEHGYEVVVVDDHSTSSPGALAAVRDLAGRDLAAHRADLRDAAALDRVFTRHRIDAVIHFAARKAVGESTLIPLDYYDINVGGTVALLRAMVAHDVRRLVFSSSCSIYGDGGGRPLTEADPARPTNPYARSKWMCEQIIADAVRRHPELSATALRYFNPAGAHPSGRLGEDPRGPLNNVVPFLMQIAIGRRDRLRVFGGDWPTPDGTAVRDYVHVVEIAEGHRLALDQPPSGPGLRVLNLGTGVGTSVLELVTAFGAACGRDIPYDVVGRRAGDVAELVADPGRVAAEWGWKAGRDVAAMCRDAWRFQRLHPDGYPD
ncbi:UDP-glucose 4-epimerase GalE [Pseudonocardia sp. 73-21]|jgi:UDP-glucose 4-epimerase|uniref:UDP-glucose 4-epimerase GalE n=1 Tax=Pseudonocardia sp. 73-21 TaxID=1895809 RepID=UPI000A66A9C9|nr:UDP-glucose 4-epimerase GalE [Pseudonocardia sp. 73-21]